MKPHPPGRLVQSPTSPQGGAQNAQSRENYDYIYQHPARAANPLPEPPDNMEAPEEHDSPTEAPQPAVEEEETRTFKDLVRVDDCGFSAPAPGAGREQLPPVPAGAAPSRRGLA